MKFDKLMAAATYLRKYALAVESHLYMQMKTDEAMQQIKEAEDLADFLEDEAAKVPTVAPSDPQ